MERVVAYIDGYNLYYGLRTKRWKWSFQDCLDTALLVSADSDLVGPVKAIRRLFPQKRVVVAFPPARTSGALRRASHAYTFVGRDVLSDSVFPERVIKPDGFALFRPPEWR